MIVRGVRVGDCRAVTTEQTDKTTHAYWTGYDQDSTYRRNLNHVEVLSVASNDNDTLIPPSSVRLRDSAMLTLN